MTTNGNGDIPILGGKPVDSAQQGAIPIDHLPPEMLAKLEHVQWLRQFALLMEQQTKEREIPMTPFRAGTIGRLRLAAQYIQVLEVAAVALKDKIRHREREIELLKEDLHGSIDDGRD